MRASENKFLDDVRDGKIDKVRKLLDRGASPNTKRDNGFTALHIACQHGDLDMAQLLIDRGADIEATTTAKVTPLFNASGAGDLAVVRLLSLIHI